MRNLHSIADTPPSREGSFLAFYRGFQTLDPGFAVQDYQRRFLNDYFSDFEYDRGAERRETENLLIRLERARNFLVASGPRLPAEVVLRVTPREMYLLRGYAYRHRYLGMFGPEGALPSFRGIPLCVDGT